MLEIPPQPMTKFLKSITFSEIQIIKCGVACLSTLKPLRNRTLLSSSQQKRGKRRTELLLMYENVSDETL